MLADQGAEVLRIDRSSAAGRGSSFDVLNRGRRSLAVDLKNPDAVAMVLDLGFDLGATSQDWSDETARLEVVLVETVASLRKLHEAAHVDVLAERWPPEDEPDPPLDGELGPLLAPEPDPPLPPAGGAVLPGPR